MTYTMGMSNNIAQEIKQRQSISEYIGKFVALKHQGNYGKGLCPFHQEKTPSFVVSEDKGIWHCFGCNKGGDVITFAMEYERISFTEAVKEFAQKLNITYSFSDDTNTTQKERDELLTIHDTAKKYFEYILKKTNYGKKAQDYLKNRNIPEKVQNFFCIGYSLNSFNGLYSFLHKKGFSDYILSRSGLFAQKNTRSLYDRFRGRIMFPILDNRGNCIAFSGRILNSKDSEAKYINSPETELYQKRSNLFGFYQAKEHIKKEDNVILVEGEFDVITPFIHGIGNIVAIKGTALTVEHIQLLRRFTSSITFCLDTDSAGINALKKSAQLVEEYDMNMYVIDISSIGVKDLDEAFNKDPIVAKKIIDQKVSFYDAILNILTKQYPPITVENQKKLSDEMLTYLSQVKNPIVQGFYIKKLSAIATIDEQDIRKLLTIIHRKKQSIVQKPLAIDNQKDILREKENALFSIAIKAPAVLEYISSEIISTPIMKELFVAIKDFIKKNSLFDEEKFGAQLGNSLKPSYEELILRSALQPLGEEKLLLRNAYAICLQLLKNKRFELEKKEELTNDEKGLLNNIKASYIDIEKKLLV